MAKICKLCGNKIGYIEIPLTLNHGNFILCEKCRNIVGEPLRLISNARSVDEVNQLNKRVKDDLRENFASDDILNIIDDFCKDIISTKSKYFENTNVAQELEEQLQLEKERAKTITYEEMKLHMITTGFNFENYNIKKYCGIVSGNVVLGTGFFSEMSSAFADLTGEQSSLFSDKMQLAKSKALQKLIVNSILKGGNALIGVDFDFVSFSNNMIGVSANGTSVIIDLIK